MQSQRDDPDICYFVDHGKTDMCPFELLRKDSNLAKIYQFAAHCIDKHEKTEETKTTSLAANRARGKIKKIEYSLSIEKFNFACGLFAVKDDDKLEALKWASSLSKAASEAPQWELMKARKARWGK